MFSYHVRVYTERAWGRGPGRVKQRKPQWKTQLQNFEMNGTRLAKPLTDFYVFIVFLVKNHVHINILVYLCLLNVNENIIRQKYYCFQQLFCKIVAVAFAMAQCRLSAVF